MVLGKYLAKAWRSRVEWVGSVWIRSENQNKTLMENMGAAEHKQVDGRIWGPLNFLHPAKLRASYMNTVYEHYCKNWCSTHQGFLRAAKTFEKDTDVDLTGKVCLVTGANQGIGYAAAEGLASRGADVYMVCRNKEKGEQAVSNIKSLTNNQNVFLEICDLSSLQQVQSLASRFNGSNKPLHVLVNNAGGSAPTRRETEDGLEQNFATNVAGMFTITELLLPALEKGLPYARVIIVSSSRMYLAPLLKHVQFEDKKEFNPMEQYARNKRLQVAITEYWAKVYGPKGVGFYSMHPGWTKTEAAKKHNPKAYEAHVRFMRDPEEGADTIIWLATRPMSKLKPGGFYIDRKARPKHIPGFRTSYRDDDLRDTVSVVQSLCKLPKS